MSPSNRQHSALEVFYKEAATMEKMTPWQKIHAYIYSKWLYLYISIGTGEHILCKACRPIAYIIALFKSDTTPTTSTKKETLTFADTYHGKVLTTKSARQLVTLNKKIDLRNLEQVIPYKRAKDIIVRNPESIVALECPCRAARKTPCTPIDVCLIVGEPFASVVREHHPKKSRRISGAEAENILEEEHKRGHVHHAFFKDAMLDRFYAICNCCKCCCGAMQAFRNGTPMLSSSGYICEVNSQQCIGCGLCAKTCQFEALQINNKIVTIDNEKCMGCGACISSCKPLALTLTRDSTKAEPLEIHRLLEEVLEKSKEREKTL